MYIYIHTKFMYSYILYPGASQHLPPCLYKEGCFDTGLDMIWICLRVWIDVQQACEHACVVHVDTERGTTMPCVIRDWHV